MNKGTTGTLMMIGSFALLYATIVSQDLFLLVCTVIAWIFTADVWVKITGGKE